MKSLNPLFVTNNARFRKQVFHSVFEKKLLGFQIMSNLIIISFPLITQFFLHVLYPSYNSTLLFGTAVCLMVLFIIKVYLDYTIQRYARETSISFERRCKEQIVEKYYEKVDLLLTQKSSLFTAHIRLFNQLMVIYRQFIVDIVGFCITFVLILLYDIWLFIPVLCSAPFFILFFLYAQKIFFRSDKKNMGKDFSLELQSHATDGKLTQSQKDILIHKINQQAKIKQSRQTNGSLFISCIQSFTFLFRVMYLVFFGYLFFTKGVSLVGLIVGLLYITILFRPLIQQIKNMRYWYICAPAYYKILSLFK